MKKTITIGGFFLLLFLLTPKLAFSQEKQAGISATMVAKDIRVDKDNRVIVLREYLKSHDSPLAQYADVFVEEADKNNIDWKMLAAISGVESTFAHQLPQNSYNAWGWGIFGDNIHYFKSYEDAISTISQGLRENYINKWGAKNIYEIGRFYAASPTWASRVEHFMNKIDDFSTEVALQKLSISI